MIVTQPKVFISSTVNDLPNERKAAYNAVNKVGAYPVMSEFTMSAQDDDSLTACLNKVKESDIYVLILGGRYGWQPNGKESITELEFQTAQDCKMPILVFNTAYQKEDLQKDFAKRAEAIRFRKTVSDAFELETAIEKSLQEEIEKKQNEFFCKTEYVYSNLVKIQFPQNVYLAKLNIDVKEVNSFNKKRGKYKKKPSLFDNAVSALYMKDIVFSRDWALDGNNILTFHDLRDPNIGLSQIIDRGTVEKLNCRDFYTSSQDKLSSFKYLLKRCFETKLHKLDIRWIKEKNVFAFIPTQKDAEGNWKPRTAKWTKTSKIATRTVVDIKRNLKDRNKVYNLKCLAFRSRFEYLDNQWFVSINPDWIFLWANLNVCSFGSDSIEWLKRKERNAQVFNHFNFILKYLQPLAPSLIPQIRNYSLLTIGQIEKFEFAPIVPDDIWINLESDEAREKLNDRSDNVGLFGT